MNVVDIVILLSIITYSFSAFEKFLKAEKCLGCTEKCKFKNKF